QHSQERQGLHYVPQGARLDQADAARIEGAEGSRGDSGHGGGVLRPSTEIGKAGVQSNPNLKGSKRDGGPGVERVKTPRFPLFSRLFYGNRLLDISILTRQSTPCVFGWGLTPLVGKARASAVNGVDSRRRRKRK